MVKTGSLPSYNLFLTFSALANLYVEFEIRGRKSESKKSSIKKDCRFNPEWDEMFILDVMDQYRDELKVKVKDAKTYWLLGSGTISLSSFYDYVEQRNWHKLDGENGNAEILLALTIGPAFESLEGDGKENLS